MTAAEIIEAIKGMSVLELNDLVKACAPCMIFPRIFKSIFSGKQRIFNAVFTVPPIA